MALNTPTVNTLWTTEANVSTATNVTATSASFTPPANSLLVLLVTVNQPNQTTDTRVQSVTTTGLTWTRRAECSWTGAAAETLPAGGAAQGGPGAEIWTTTVGASPAAMTVAVVVKGAGAAFTEITCQVAMTTDGSGTVPAIGAAATAEAASGGVPSAALTTSAGSYVFACATNWTANGTATFGAGQTQIYNTNPNGNADYYAWRTTSTTLAGTTTVNVTLPAGEQFNMAALEVQAPGGASGEGFWQRGTGPRRLTGPYSRQQQFGVDATPTTAASASGSLTLDATSTAAGTGTAGGSLTLAAAGTGTANAAAAGSLTLGGTGIASAPVAGAGSVTLAGTTTATGATTAAGSLTLTATASTAGPTAAGNVTLTGSSTAASPVTAAGSLTLAGTGTATGAATSAGSLTLTGSGTVKAATSTAASLNLTGAATVAGAATTTGGVTLTAAGTVTPPGTNANGAITLAGTSTAAGKPTAAGSFTLAATSTAAGGGTAAGSLILSGTTAVSGRGAAAGALTLIGQLAARANTAALGTLTLTATATVGIGQPVQRGHADTSHPPRARSTQAERTIAISTVTRRGHA